MEKWQIGENADAAAEVERLLQYNGFIYHREGDRFRLVFSQGGRKWETLFVCKERLALIYGRYPFRISDQQQALAACQQINSQLILGSAFLSEGHIVVRTGADLIDTYSAYEYIGRALEYNAGVIAQFWSQIAACAPESTGNLGKVQF